MTWQLALGLLCGLGLIVLLTVALIRPEILE